MLTKCVILGSALFMTGCVHGITSPRASQLDGEIMIFEELAIEQTGGFDLALYAAPGPSLVAGDGVAMQWAVSHQIISYAATENSWHTTMVYLD